VWERADYGGGMAVSGWDGWGNIFRDFCHWEKPSMVRVWQPLQKSRLAERMGRRLPVSTEFPAGSLEAELSAIGRSVPTEEWAKVPPDYFANLDYYRYGGLKKK
jgi:hypothetical protein